MTALDRFVGVHEDDAPTYTSIRFPGARWTRRFISDAGAPLRQGTTGGWLERHVLAAVHPAVEAGGGCMVSLKLDLPAVAAGRWNDRLGQLGLALAALNVIVVINHEPENDMTGEVFTAGFTAARNALKATAPMVPVGYAAMAYQWRPGSATTADAHPWTDVIADMYLVDVYSGQSFPQTAILPEHPGFVRWFDEMITKNPGRRWGIAERGWHSGPHRASTIRREARWLADDPVGQGCGGCLVWGTEGTEANAAWRLDDPASIRAVISYVNALAWPRQSPPELGPAPIVDEP